MTNEENKDLTRGEGRFINCTDYDDAIKVIEMLKDEIRHLKGMLKDNGKIFNSPAECEQAHVIKSVCRHDWNIESYPIKCRTCGEIDLD